MTGGPVRIGVIGAGTISQQYLTNLTAFPDVAVVAIGDLVPEAAQARALEFGVPRHGSTDEVLADPEVELIVNLTIPSAHFAVTSAALERGKHVWTEKPLAMSRSDGQILVDLARREGLRLGGAPDTVLGPGFQTSLRLLRGGRLGQLQSALSIFQDPGPDRWHPNPSFLFQEGAGPVYDIGPYYLTSLALALGPMTSVYAVGSRAREQRRVVAGPRAGEVFDVTVPTQVTTTIQYASGANSTSILSFDSPHRRHGFLELSGAEGSLSAPDPNMFDGEVRVAESGGEWALEAETSSDCSRGLGALDMARSLRSGTPHRLQGDLALHVLDALVAIEESVATGGPVPLSTSFEPTAPVDEDWDPREHTLG